MNHLQTIVPLTIGYSKDPKTTPVQTVALDNGYSREILKVYLENSCSTSSTLVTILSEEADAEVSFAVSRINSVIEALELIRDRGVV